jgi:UDP-N-acetylglucosamine acyltransferase
MADIHPSALIDPAAELADDVKIGAFCLVEAGVSLAAGVVLEAQAQVLQGSRIGAGTVIGRGAIIGGLPQDLGFDPATDTGVIIGEHNTLREHVTVNRATRVGTSTIIGDKNYLMTGVHLAHDVVIGSRNVLANNCLLAGHVHLGDGTVIGGGAGFHQFLRIGDGCMLQGNGSFTKDLPPFVLAGQLNQLHGLNSIGLRRAGHGAAERLELKRLFDLLWRQRLSLTVAVAKARQTTWGPLAQRLLDFVSAPSKKGVISYRRRRADRGSIE